MSQKTTPPVIVELKLATLIKDYALAGRSEKEIKENAKDLAPMLAGGWSPSQPGEFFIRDGKPHLAAGFTRTAAAEMNELKTGFFVEIPDDAATLRTVCIRTNASKAIKPFEQGRIYAAMEKGTDITTAEAGAEILPPMTQKQIAEAVGKKVQWIGACISIFESPEEIHPLIEEGRVSAGVVKRARELVKDEKKLIRFVKAIVKKADEDGKQTATFQHLDAVRPEFAPLKAKASKETPAKAEKPAKGANAPESEEAGTGGDSGEDSGQSGDSTETQSEPETGKTGYGKSAQPELFGKTDDAPAAKKSKLTPEKMRAELLVVVNSWCDETSNSPTDPELDQLLDALTEWFGKLGSPF